MAASTSSPASSLDAPAWLCTGASRAANAYLLGNAAAWSLRSRGCAWGCAVWDLVVRDGLA
eukprot:15252919-Alexandrium_andersonii.AAC.1